MKRKGADQRARQANWQAIRLAQGICPRCGGERLDFNPRTGKAYALGPRCRALKADTQKRLMSARRAAGQA